ncbi:MAG TPA: hypothetical protein VFY56_00285, partial [Propionibacteriaceae bacterium]|nr:hypothetical protein [Propionibacteriaceae bacterium]
MPQAAGVAEDQLIIVNPRRIRGAGEERASERPVLTVDQLYPPLSILMPERVEGVPASQDLRVAPL